MLKRYTITLGIEQGDQGYDELVDDITTMVQGCGGQVVHMLDLMGLMTVECTPAIAREIFQKHGVRAAEQDGTAHALRGGWS